MPLIGANGAVVNRRAFQRKGGSLRYVDRAGFEQPRCTGTGWGAAPWPVRHVPGSVGVAPVRLPGLK